MIVDPLVIIISMFMLYYFVTLFFYFTRTKDKEFYEMVLFPLPIAFFLIFIHFLFFDVNNTENYQTMVSLLIMVSVISGLFVLYNCLLDWKKRDWLLFVKFLTSITLILCPLIFYSPEITSFLVVIFLTCGILLGINGYLTYHYNKKVGLLYVYTSLVFIIIIPTITFAVAKFYQNNYEPEILYRRARDNVVTCHLPATPIIPGPEGFHLSILLSGLFVFMFSVLSSIRKNRLQKRLRREGVIPNEFYEIIQDKGSR